MGKVRRKRREWTQEEIEEAKRLYAEGLNFTQIGVEIGRSNMSVRKKLVALGIKSNKKMLWDVLEIRDNIINVDEAKKVTHGSGKKLLFKCSSDDCDNTKKMAPNTLVRRGYSCPTCSKGTSYGQLAFHSYQTHFKLGLESEKMLETLNSRFVDFVKFDAMGNVKYFVEIQGEQHYKPNEFFGGIEKFGKQKASDVAKRLYCEQIGWTYVAIDARKSDFNFIRDNINACEYLPNITKEDEKAIMKLIEKNSVYDVKEIKKLYLDEMLTLREVANKLGLTADIVKSVLKRNNIKLRGNRMTQRKAIKCIELNQVFESSMDAMRQTGITQQNISSVCNPDKPNKTAGGYHWEFVEVFEE